LKDIAKEYGRDKERKEGVSNENTKLFLVEFQRQSSISRKTVVSYSEG
jgi:hypothetical protein